jgi:STE24 endopeptidase
MNSYLFAVIFILVFWYLLDLAVSLLTIRSLAPELPKEFKDVYDSGEYARSQEYTKVTTRFAMVQGTVSLSVTIGFILLGGFNLIDLWARGFGFSVIITGLIFTGILILLLFLSQLPFAIYSTFVIEEKYGLNRTTVRTFIMDMVKGAALAIVLGGPLLAMIFWFFESAGNLAWFYCWLLVAAFSFIMQFVSPVLIMPLFNKFTPLEDGELKNEILRYTQKQNFALKGIYTMDGSKRSGRLNAFFTGFGRFRRIVFFDTLVDKLRPKEIVAVLAHEMGHFRKKHIMKMMAASLIQTGLSLYILSWFIKNPELAAAFGLKEPTVYAGMVFFGFLYTPIATLFSVVGNMFSRKYEYEADQFAVNTSNLGEELTIGLKKLCQSNLANLTPHKLEVFLHHSHPSVLARIERIRYLCNEK